MLICSARPNEQFVAVSVQGECRSRWGWTLCKTLVWILPQDLDKLRHSLQDWRRVTTVKLKKF